MNIEKYKDASLFEVEDGYIHDFSKAYYNVSPFTVVIYKEVTSNQQFVQIVFDVVYYLLHNNYNEERFEELKDVFPFTLELIQIFESTNFKEQLQDLLNDFEFLIVFVITLLKALVDKFQAFPEQIHRHGIQTKKLQNDLFLVIQFNEFTINTLNLVLNDAKKKYYFSFLP